MYEVESELLSRAIELCRDVKPKVPLVEAAMLKIAITILKEIRSILFSQSTQVK